MVDGLRVYVFFFVFFLDFFQIDFFVLSQNVKKRMATALGNSFASLLLQLSRNEMILACQQDLLLSPSTITCSTLDLLLSISPLTETGNVSSITALNNIHGLLSTYCSNDEVLLAMRAFCTNKSHLDYDSFSYRIVQRKSLWKNCNTNIAKQIATFVEKTETQTTSMRRMNDEQHHRKAMTLNGAEESSLSSLPSVNNVAKTMLHLLLHELTIERLSEAKKRHVAGHEKFNIPALFSIRAAYDTERNQMNLNPQKSRRRMVTMHAIQKFCERYNVRLENWHLRSLLSRYRNPNDQDVLGLSYQEFETMVVEMKVDCYDQQLICGMNNRERIGFESDRQPRSRTKERNEVHVLADDSKNQEQMVHRTGIKSSIVRKHMERKYGRKF